MDHLRIKPMWAGSNTRSDITNLMTFVIDPALKKVTPKNVRLTHFPDSLAKCYDELIVNAVDHIASCREEAAATQVSYIAISFDTDTLAFTIENDGRGIDISRFPKTDENFPGKWKPYVFFTEEKQGTNAFKETKCVKAGVNGYGSKIVIAHAATVQVVCENVAQGKRYEHTHRNNPDTGKYIFGKPIVTESTPQRRIILDDDFKVTGTEGSKTFVSFTQITEGPAAPTRPIYGTDIDAWLRYRLVYISSYVKMLTKTFGLRDVHIVYTTTDNGKDRLSTDLSWVSFKEIAEGLKKPTTDVVAFVISPTTPTAIIDGAEVDLYPLEVTFCLKGLETKTGIISNTNGTLIEAGAHLEGLFHQIADGVTKKIISKIKNNEIKVTRLNVTSNCMMFVNAIIPGLEFGEQSKKKAIIDKAITASYAIPAKILKKLTDMLLRDVILGSVETLEKKMNKKVKISDKYDEAASRARDRSDFILVIVEGDSAKSALIAGISSLSGSYDVDKMGFMTLHGGIPNSRKKSTILTDDDGNEKIILDGMSMNNLFLNTLQKALGVKVGEYADIDRLRYGRVVCCVDQDHDGKGKLFGLIMNAFAYFWPELLNGSFLYKLEFPIVRVYPSEKLSKIPSNALETFYYDHEMEGYKIKPAFEVRYYKGLGSYTKLEMRLQCMNFFNNLRAFRFDSKAERVINDYYGVDTEPRKRILSHPLEHALQFYQSRERAISNATDTPVLKVSDFLSSDVFLFAKDDIIRKLPHAIDGFNDSGRKIVHALIKRRNNRRMKVAEMAGYVQSSQNYHHGENCLENNIKGKCFIAVGGRQIPHMIPEGHFGNRLCGGKSAAASRYIHVTPNAAILDILYPDADADFLEYTMDDGKFYEPNYLAPIIPMAVIETMSMPSHGWNFFVQGRDVLSVIDRVKRMILSDDTSFYRPLKMDCRGFTGDYVFNPYTLEERSIGRYTVQRDKIIITEVPIGRWLIPYRASLCAKIVFYGLDASVGQPNVAEDGSFTLTVHVSEGFWEKVEKPSTSPSTEKTLADAFMTSKAVARFAKKCVADEIIQADEVPPELLVKDSDATGLVKMCNITKKEIEAAFGKDTTKLFKKPTKKAAKSKTAKSKAAKKTDLDKYIDADNDDFNDASTSKKAIDIRVIGVGEKYSIASFLDLEDSHYTSLNMIDCESNVRSFGKDYQSVIDYWFEVRREIYEKRVHRQMTLNRLELEVTLNTLKYCKGYDFKQRPESDANDLLTEMGIKAINVTKIRKPGNATVTELEACISDEIDGDNDYEYLWKMSVRDARSREKIARLEKEAIKQTVANAMYTERCNSGRFPGAMIWYDEVDQLEKVIRNGQSDNWGQ